MLTIAISVLVFPSLTIKGFESRSTPTLSSKVSHTSPHSLLVRSLREDSMKMKFACYARNPDTLNIQAKLLEAKRRKISSTSLIMGRMTYGIAKFLERLQGALNDFTPN